MARKRSPTLTEGELRLMEIVWDRGEASVSDVVAALPKKLPLAYSTVLTTLRILEQKGYVRHTELGRAYIYRPLIGRDEARQTAVRYIVSRFFRDSPGQLALNVLQHEKISENELARLKQLIEESEERLP